MNITLVYALPQEQAIVARSFESGTTARDAVLASGLDQRFPALDLRSVPIGVYGELVADDYLLEEGDRIELLRPLVVDPMEARRRRAKKSG